MGKRETPIQRDIQQYLRKRKIKCLRLSSVNLAGEPDLLAIYKGYAVGIEVKAPDGRATELQLKKLHSIIDAGGFGMLAESVEDVESMLNYIDIKTSENQYPISFKVTDNVAKWVNITYRRRHGDGYDNT